MLNYWTREKFQKFLYLVLVIIAFGIIFVLATFPLEDGDTWTHLKYGQFIVENKVVPSTDIYSYTRTGMEYFDHEWLAQVIFYLIYYQFSIDGLILFKALVILLAFVILWRTAFLLYGRSFFSVFILVAMASAGTFRFVERPDMFSFLCLSLVIYLVFTYGISKHDFKILFLPLVFLFWVNTHGSFVIGWGMLGLFLMFQIIFFLLRKKFIFVNKFLLPRKKFIFFLIASLFSFLICFLNPYGYKMILLPFQGVFGVFRFMAEINEWKSPFDPMHQHQEYVIIFVISAVLLFLLFIYNLKKFHPLYFFLFLYFLFISLKGVRNISYFAMGVYLPFIYNLKQFFSSLKYTKFQKKYFYPIFQTIIISLFFIFYLSLIFKGNSFGFNYHRFDLGVNEKAFPFKAVDFLDQVNIQGNMFNQYNVGSFLIWRSYPERKVFIDGRTGLYGEEFYFSYKNFASSPAELKKATTQYDFNYMVLIESRFLQNNPDWRLVYFDDVCRIYLKNNDRNKEIINQYGFEYLDPNLNIIDLINRYQSIDLEKLENELVRALTQNYQSFTAHSLLSDLYYFKDEKSKAWQQLQSAKQVMPHFPQIYLAIGNYYVREKDFRLAEKNYKKALSHYYQSPKVYHNLGYIYLNEKKYQKAFKKFQKAIDLDKNFALSYLGLGEVYADYFNEPEKAIASFETYLKLNPNAKEKNEIENKIRTLRSNESL